MNGFEVKKDSWHLRWINYYRMIVSIDNIIDFHDHKNRYEYNKRALPRDFCSYWRAALLWPAIRLLFNIAALAAAIAFISFTHFTIAAGMIFLMFFGAAAVALGLFVSIMFIAYKSKDVKEKIFEIYHGIEDTSLFKTMHETYKKKFCPIVEYKDE